MAFDKLKKPILSNEEAEDEENADDEAQEGDVKGSRLGTLKKSLGIALAAAVAVVTLRKVRNRGNDEEDDA